MYLAVHRLRLPRLAALLAVCFAGALLAHAAQPALAFSASGPILPSGSGLGSGSSTSVSGSAATVSVNLQGARANATYGVYACLALVTGGFDCVGKNNPPAFSQVQVAPRALAPIVVSLVEQGTFTTDGNGNGSTVVALLPQLLPDTPASLYDVVQLVNQADLSDAYTGLDLQAPQRPVAGNNPYPYFSTSLAIGTPVFVFSQFPGYAFPIAITTVGGLPFVPSFTVPLNALGLYPSGYNFYNGPCPNGGAPVAQAGPLGAITFSC